VREAHTADFFTNSPNSQAAISQEPGHPTVMLTEICIEALLVDEELADQVWEALDARKIDDSVAALAWWLIVNAGRLREVIHRIHQ